MSCPWRTYALVQTRSWAANSSNGHVQLRAQKDHLDQENNVGGILSFRVSQRARL
jgi:hypothetical protein